MDRYKLLELELEINNRYNNDVSFVAAVDVIVNEAFSSTITEAMTEKQEKQILQCARKSAAFAIVLAEKYNKEVNLTNLLSNIEVNEDVPDGYVVLMADNIPIGLLRSE